MWWGGVEVVGDRSGSEGGVEDSCGKVYYYGGGNGCNEGGCDEFVKVDWEDGDVWWGGAVMAVSINQRPGH